MTILINAENASDKIKYSSVIFKNSQQTRNREKLSQLDKEHLSKKKVNIILKSEKLMLSL